MRKQFPFYENKKTLETLGFTGKVVQMFVNSYRTEEVVDPNAPAERRVITKLTETKVDLELSGLKLLEDYYGSPLDEFNILTEEFEVSDMTQLEINIDGQIQSGTTLKYPVVITFVYELPQKQKRTDLR